MKNRLFRGLTFSIAIIYGGLSSISPAHAFAPVAVIGLPQVIATGGATYPIAALASLIGMAGLYLGIKDTEGNEARIPLSTSPASEPPAPSLADLPATTPVTQTKKYCAFNYCGDLETACQVSVANNGTVPGWTYVGLVQNGSCYMKGTREDGYIVTTPHGVAEQNTTTCASGYVLNNGACQLDTANARQARPDKKCDILIKNGGFGYAADADCPIGATTDHSKAVPIIRNDGGKVIVYGKDANGNDIAVETTYDAVRKVTTVTQSTQQGSNVKTEVITISSDVGTVTGATTSLSPGQITTPTASPTAPSTPSNPSTTPTVTTDPTKQPVQDPVQTCGLPGKPACQVDDSGFSTVPKPWDSSTMPDFDTAKKEIEKGSEPLLDWRVLLPNIMPGTPITCRPIEFRGKITGGPANGLDSTTELDLCWLFTILRYFFGFIFGATTVIYVWRTFTSSQSWGR